MVETTKTPGQIYPTGSPVSKADIILFENQIKDAIGGLAQAGDTLALINVTGTGDAAVAEKRPVQADLVVSNGTLLTVQWPVTNTASDPTLTIAETTLTVRRFGGAAIEPGELVGGRRYLFMRVGSFLLLVAGAGISDVFGLSDELQALETGLTETSESVGQIRDQFVITASQPVLVDADADGYARFVLRDDGTMESTRDIIHGGNIMDLPGVKFAETDTSGRAVRAQLDDGSFVVRDPAPPRGLAGDVHLLLVDGQSPFAASATTAISTTPHAGLMMFNAGAMPTAANFANAETAMTSFVPHVEQGNETSARGAAEGLLAGAESAGRSLAESEIVSVVTAVGGQSVKALSPGGDYWINKTAAVDRWAAICADNGQAPGQVFWAVWQGEADTSLPIGGAAWAAKWEAARVALEDHIEAVLGWRVPVVQVHMQTAANFYYNRPLPLISEATNLATEYPRIFGSLPTYDFDYGAADGVGSHLSTGVDSFSAGWRCGFAIGQCWAGQSPERIVPTGATRLGPRAVRIDYGGGYPAPLTISTAVVSDPGDYGYQIGAYDAGGSFVALGLASVSVAGGEAVMLRTTADLPASPLVIRYGYIGGTLDDGDPDPFGSFAGRLTGARGCLQSATGRTFNFDGNTIPQILRPAIHNIILE